MVDRDGTAIDIVLETDKDVIGSRGRAAARPHLSAIVLGPLMVDRVEMFSFSDGFLASQAFKMYYSL